MNPEPTPASPSADTPTFSLWRSFKLGTFHIGSSLTDLLTSAIWNRILITDLGVAAWPVAVLTALRYLLAPLTLWVGHQSDTRPIFGSRRVAYIWLGRLLMLCSLPLLPFSMAAIGFDKGSIAGWSLAVLSFLLYGIGTLISGAPFLALVHDSAPYERRGQAISIVQTFLVASFAFLGFLYGQLLPAWDYARFWRLVILAMIGAALLWVFSVWREERGAPAAQTTGPAPSFRATFASIWAEPRTRRYGIFLGVSAFFAFMQDSMLEPFGGDVFGLSVGETTRFNAYWGVGVLLAMIGTAIATRRWRPHQQVSTTAWGLGLLAFPLLFLSVAAATTMASLLRPVLVLFGIGFGIFTVGGVSLLMAMSRADRAGSYLALWSVIQLVTRGAGIAMGGVVRDVALHITGDYSSAYAILFAIEAIGLLIAIPLLLRVGVATFNTQPVQGSSAADLLAATAD